MGHLVFTRLRCFGLYAEQNHSENTEFKNFQGVVEHRFFFFFKLIAWIFPKVPRVLFCMSLRTWVYFSATSLEI